MAGDRLKKGRSDSMKKRGIPVTPAIRMLKNGGMDFDLLPYRATEKGGTADAARALAVDEHRVVKTLVMENDKKAVLIVLMHGDRSVSTKSLARLMGCKQVRPCEARTANRATGYFPGGISPFGTRRKLPVYVESSILEMDPIYINAGKKGVLCRLSPAVLVELLGAIPVRVAI